MLQRTVFGVAVLVAACAPAWASTAFDMEAVPFGYYPGALVVVDGGLTLTVTPEGVPSGWVYAVNVGVPLLGNVAVVGTSANPIASGRFTPLRFSFDQDIDSITFNFGDSGADSDSPVEISAYSFNGTLLGTLSETYPQNFGDGKSLTLSFAGARYFIGSSGSNIRNPNSIGWDISAITPSANGVIPEPATWAMMIAGFGLVGAAARRRKTVSA